MARRITRSDRKEKSERNKKKTTKKNQKKEEPLTIPSCLAGDSSTGKAGGTEGGELVRNLLRTLWVHYCTLSKFIAVGISWETGGEVLKCGIVVFL